MTALTVMTLNFQYFAGYPEDEDAGLARIREITAETEGGPPPDIICVQEGLDGKDVLTPAGYDLLVSSKDHAQPVEEMVYHHQQTLANIDEQKAKALLTNELFVRRGSSWEVADSGVVKISSSVNLEGGGERIAGPLAIRSLVWAKLRQRGSCLNSPAVFVLNCHITGGRFEDQYFVQQLSGERKIQPERVIDEFNGLASAGDIGILVGDFNATDQYREKGPMQGYFSAAIAKSPGVLQDAQRIGINGEQQLEQCFQEYMISPFNAIKGRGWTFAYAEADIGTTSAFGHMVDHMAVSHPGLRIQTEKFYTTNQRFSDKTDTGIPITDHNAVKATFYVDEASRTKDVQETVQKFLRAHASPGTQKVSLDLIQRFLVGPGRMQTEEASHIVAALQRTIAAAPEEKSIDYKVFIDWLFFDSKQGL